jgi:hypothetical protein
MKLGHKNGNLFHFIWLGSPLPEADKARIEKWSTFGDVNLVTEIPAHLKDLADKAESVHAKSDLLRYWLVYEYGGTYLDTDCLPGNRTFMQPDGPYAAGFPDPYYSIRWSNFVVGASDKHDPFWEATLERCESGQRSEDDRIPMPDYQLKLYLYNIEYIWGLDPIISTISCRQGDIYDKESPYMVHHLATVNEGEYFKDCTEPPIESGEKRYPNLMNIMCPGCSHYVNKRCTKYRKQFIRSCEHWGGHAR